MNTDEVTLLEGQQRAALQKILELEGESVWEILEELSPGHIETAAWKVQHQKRQAALAVFEQAMEDPRKKESWWQQFFESNEWLFGHGLDYRYLKHLQAQPYYGGMTLEGRGALRGDYLLATLAQVRFTVIVEIKTPLTQLLGKERYRNGAYQLGEELTGAVAQLQAQCHRWSTEGSRQGENAERLIEQGVYTVEPKGILVIGSTQQVKGDVHRRATFERWRRNLHNPEILTFDELLERARLLVKPPPQAPPH